MALSFGPSVGVLGRYTTTCRDGGTFKVQAAVRHEDESSQVHE